MSEVREFFRHCPSCGHRFTIRIVSKEKVGEREVTEYEPKGQMDVSPGLKFATPAEDTADLTEGIPIYVDVKTFSYKYKCSRCGHQWTEVREKDKASRA